MRAIGFGCHLVPVFMSTRRYVLIRVAQFSIGESKFSLVTPLDLGSGGAILRGSSPLSGMIRNEVCGRASREIGAAYGPRTSWDSSTAKVVDRVLSARTRPPETEGLSNDAVF